MSIFGRLISAFTVRTTWPLRSNFTSSWLPENSAVRFSGAGGRGATGFVDAVSDAGEAAAGAGIAGDVDAGAAGGPGARAGVVAAGTAGATRPAAGPDAAADAADPLAFCARRLATAPAFRASS